MDFQHVMLPQAKAYILPIGDIHWGDKAFKRGGREKLKGNLDWAWERRDHTRIVLMGDLYNVAGINEKTSPFESNDEEGDEVEEFFAPYKDIIVGAVTGNHENRIQRAFGKGFNPTKRLCKHLGIKYLGTSGLIRIQVGKRPDSNSYWQNYYMYVHHTAGGGGLNPFSAVQKLEQIVPGCDIYAGGHNHQLAEMAQERYLPTYSGPEKRRVHFVVCGSYLEYPESYAETAMLRPGKLGSPRIRLNGERDQHDIHISI